MPADKSAATSGACTTAPGRARGAGGMIESAAGPRVLAGTGLVGGAKPQIRGGGRLSLLLRLNPSGDDTPSTPFGPTCKKKVNDNLTNARFSRGRASPPSALLLPIVLHPRLEALDAFGEIAHYARQLAREEQDENDRQNHKPVSRTVSFPCSPPRCRVRPRFLRGYRRSSVEKFFNGDFAGRYLLLSAPQRWRGRGGNPNSRLSRLRLGCPSPINMNRT